MPRADRNVIRRRTRYFAEASLVFAVLGPCSLFVLACFPGSRHLAGLAFLVGCSIALIFGFACRLDGGETTVLSCVAMVLGAVGLPFALGLSYGCGLGLVARQSQLRDNLKHIGIALHKYHGAHGRFPPAVIRDADGSPLYSWRVAILPYLDETGLYRDFHLDERWSSPHNLALLRRCPAVYKPIGVDAPLGHTFIQVFVGPGTAFESSKGEPLEWTGQNQMNFPDGGRHTILAVEAGESVPWSAPLDLQYDPNGPIQRPGGGYAREQRLFLFGGPVLTGFQCLMADGSVRHQKWPVSLDDFRALITRNGGEVVRPGFEGR